MAFELPFATSLNDAVLLFALIFVRWTTMSMAPFLGAAIISPIIRVALALSLSLITFFLLLKEPLPIQSVFIPALFIKEAILGFLLGFFSSLIFYAYQLLGELIDMVRGASNARLLVPELKNPSSPLGVLFFQLSLCIFLSIGFHRPVLTLLFKSFLSCNPFDFPKLSFEHLRDLSLNIMSLLWELAVRLALPAIAIGLLIDATFGLLNRTAPQINAFFLSLPAKMLGGIAIVFFTLPWLFDDYALNFEPFFNLFKELLENK